ncbi:hypothetical protein ABIB58_001258 [Brevundimonas sp. UYEF29]|uniref:hypothetical protein n=1 Tax=unclassified Brevundimonas TaxID=2622653 RepID=UPI000698A200|nr:hypothetical protein [Brevundimonas sp. KM4]
MNWFAIIAGLTASLTANSAPGLSPQPHPAVGEEHEVIISYVTSKQGSDGSSSSSSGQDVLLERVIAVSNAGLELEFDLPSDATAEDRARDWKFPARILQQSNGAIRLLNGDKLDERVDRWLKASEMSRDMCGRWIFTWNAFRIECDPESVIADIAAINLLNVNLREGATYRHPQTVGSGILSLTSKGPGGAVYSVRLAVDADAVRRERAESDVVVGEITQNPVTFEAAFSERSKETVSGTVEVTFDVDASGNPTRRTVVTTLDTVKPDGVSEKDRRTDTVERVASGGTNRS